MHENADKIVSLAHVEALLTELLTVLRMEVLRIYRTILRQCRSLRYTDKEFFRREIRKEFDKWKHEKDSEEIEFQVKVLCVCVCIVQNFVYEGKQKLV